MADFRATNYGWYRRRWRTDEERKWVVRSTCTIHEKWQASQELAPRTSRYSVFLWFISLLDLYLFISLIAVSKISSFISFRFQRDFCLRVLSLLLQDASEFHLMCDEFLQKSLRNPANLNALPLICFIYFLHIAYFCILKFLHPWSAWKSAVDVWHWSTRGKIHWLGLYNFWKFLLGEFEYPTVIHSKSFIVFFFVLIYVVCFYYRSTVKKYVSLLSE